MDLSNLAPHQQAALSIVKRVAVVVTTSTIVAQTAAVLLQKRHQDRIMNLMTSQVEQ